MTPETSAAPPVAGDCWNHIGVWGADEPRCPRLAAVIHCRNCPVFAEAGRVFFRHQPPAEYLKDWHGVLAVPDAKQTATDVSLMVFRLAGEWFALPTENVREVAAAGPVHSLPHRAGPLMRGLTFIHGELLLCADLHLLLEPEGERLAGDGRRLVVEQHGEYWCCIVDAVAGLEHCAAAALQPPPVTARAAAASCLRGVYTRADGTVIGCLDAAALFVALRKALP
ncbi:MAG TPA: chemotaxis protein CheW [bacterium]|nr:chemotaxis protein CheW [bacterium]